MIEEYFPEYDEEKIFRVIKWDKKFPRGSSFIKLLESYTKAHCGSSTSRLERRMQIDNEYRLYIFHVLDAEEKLTNQ
jgi:hypothetical protein